MDITNTKMSIMDHLPRTSSQTKVSPRFGGDTTEGGANQRKSMRNILMYGQHLDQRRRATNCGVSAIATIAWLQIQVQFS